MLNREAVYRALRAGDTRKMQRILASDPVSPDNARVLLSAIKHTGCLIDRFGSKRDPDLHKSIVKLAVEYLSEDADCLEQFDQHCADSRILNAIFGRIKKIVSDLPVNALSPTQQTWAVIDWTALHLSTLYKRALEPPIGKEPFLIRPGAATSQANDGTPVDFDSMMGATEQYLRMTLSMFAYKNDWWDKNGKLCLPRRETTTQEYIHRAGAHIDLASIWDLLVSTSESLRFWGRKIDVTEIDAGNESNQTFPAFVFDLDIDERLDFLISQMRVLQLEIDFQLTQMGLPQPLYKNPESDIVPMPPGSYVSPDELLTAVLLDALWHYEIDSPDAADKLSPEKLIRGYAVLKRSFELPIETAQFTVIPFDRKRIVKALQNASLSLEEAST